MPSKVGYLSLTMFLGATCAYIYIGLQALLIAAYDLKRVIVIFCRL